MPLIGPGCISRIFASGALILARMEAVSFSLSV